MMNLDETHDPSRRSWIPSSQVEGHDFPLQNLPWGIFSRREEVTSVGAVSNSPAPRTVGVAIGDEILDMRILADSGLLDEFPLDRSTISAFRGESLNALMECSVEQRVQTRSMLHRILEESSPILRDRSGLRTAALVSSSEVTLHLPALVGNYTDFYASIHHATRVGSMFRPDQPLLPNYKWVPIAYHGRASSIVPSGQAIRRPRGQTTIADALPPEYRPCHHLDYELELGLWIAGHNSLGTTIPISKADSHFFGLSLLNDWSARDIQKWEYQPLGPFLAKNFATSVSPWVVTREALAPFRVPAAKRANGDPSPLPHLNDTFDQDHGGLMVSVEARLASAAMRAQGMSPIRLSRCDFRDMYWTVAQMITHHASNGCNLSAGDLLGSGTISGPGREARGCMLELTWDGDETNPLPGTRRTAIELPTGERRMFLADGDSLTLWASCERAGATRIGFGVCEGTILPSDVGDSSNSPRR